MKSILIEKIDKIAGDIISSIEGGIIASRVGSVVIPPPKWLIVQELEGLVALEKQRIYELLQQELKKDIPYIDKISKEKNEGYDDGYKGGLNKALELLGK